MSQIAQAYPLQWPAGWKRTPAHSRKPAQFKGSVGAWVGPDTDRRWKGQERVTLEQGIARVRRELRALGVAESQIVISSDLKLRQDGQPNAGQAWAKLDQGAAVYWRLERTHGQPVTRCMAIDRYDRLPDNLAAIAATLEAMRAIERHGGAMILDRAFTGFAALPAPAAQDLPHQVLGVDEHATRQEIEYAYRRLAQQLHPDVGGSHEQMSRINTARDAMLGALAP